MCGLYCLFGISVTMQSLEISTFLNTSDVTKTQFSAAHAASPLVHLFAGLMTKTVSAVFWVPMEVVKQLAQVRSFHEKSTTISIARDLISHEGPTELFKVYSLTIPVRGKIHFS